MLETFDIFETCLVRRVAEPPGVFDGVGRRLGLRKDFRFLRVEAEREARRREGDEIGLEAIYRVLSDWCGWDQEMTTRVMAAELAEETHQLEAVPEMQGRVMEARNAGAKIAFLSDMYLPSLFLEERLREHGFFQDGDQLWVSGECGDSKSSGTLYERVKRETGESCWRHWGNHPHADGVMALKHGLEAGSFPQGNLGEHELALLEWSKLGASIGEDWAGASRRARLSVGRLTPVEQSIAQVASGVAAPMLLAYVSWLLERATRDGLERLYFLARDGQILREIFVRIANARGSAIEARYLHASRISIRFPRVFPLPETDAYGVFQGPQGIPLEVVAMRLGITTEELAGFLPKDAAPNGTIPKIKVAACTAALQSTEACRRLNEVAKGRAANLEAYLRQEGLFDEVRFGLVDLGWGGSLQLGIQKALDDAGSGRKVRAYYAGLSRLPYGELDAEAYAFDSRQGTVRDVAWFVTTTELFCQATHGSTLGFERSRDGHMVPVLDEPDGDNPLLPDWLDLHQRVILKFTDEVVSADSLPVAPASLVRLLRAQLRRFYFSPSRSEAEAWGGCRYASHGAATTRQEIAPRPRSLHDLVWTFGVRYFGAGAAIWPYGSAARLWRPLHLLSKYLYKVRNRLKPLKW